MNSPTPLSFDPAFEAEAAPSKARKALLRRLADVVCLPGSRVNAFERAVTSDLLVEILREAPIDERIRVARRLSSLSEIPATLARLLLRDHFEVAGVLLTDCAFLNDAELLDCARRATPEHRKAIAQRRGVSDVVAEAVLEPMEPGVIEALLRNDQAKLSADSIETLVASTRENTRIIPLLLKRAELRPSHAYVIFWWSDSDARRQILQRFAVSREVMQEVAGDVFPLAAAENWVDPLSRKALQFIERRQRNRAAIEKSPFGSLEEAVSAAQSGLTREIAEEIAYLSGVKPMTATKIFADQHGEPVAILCKATGLPKAALRALWRGLGRPETEADGSTTAGLERVMITYDMMAVDRAQTVLRYWNWSLSSALTPALLKAVSEGEGDLADDYSIPQRAAILALGSDLAH